jgi:chromosome segregation ATPase
MSSASIPSEQLVTQLRQQLILAQVRIMELEDSRDEVAPKLAETEALLGEAQILVEGKVEEATHLAQVRADLQKEYEHLQHVQHVTNTALEEARDTLGIKAKQIETLNKEIELQQTNIGQLEADEKTKLEHIAKLKTELSESHKQTIQHIARIDQLDAEQRETKASRSWRWTAWIRSIERRFR